jgi:hypothetical protein
LLGKALDLLWNLDTIIDLRTRAFLLQVKQQIDARWTCERVYGS